MSPSSKSLIGRARHALRSSLQARVAWLTSDRRSLAAGEPGAGAVALVLGREHYSERRKTYPILRYADLARVLKLELAGSPNTLAVIGPIRSDRRVVSFYDMDPSVVQAFGRAAWVFPESLLLSRTLAEDAVARVQRSGLEYFLAGSGESLPVTGALRSAAMFELAVGLPGGQPAATLAGDDIPERLWTGLRRLPSSAWISLFRSPLDGIAIPWRQLGTAVGVFLLAYLSLASAYLGIATKLRQAESERLGGDVRSLLAARSELDRFAGERAGLLAVVRASPESYPIWRVVALAWQKGASITGLSFADRELTLRGNAARATDILAALAADPALADVRFTSAVQRGDANLDEFSLAARVLVDVPHGK
jgi:hypothetical protein